LPYNEDFFELDEEGFFLEIYTTLLRNSVPKPKYLVVNFPHNPTTVTVNLSFYKRLVEIAKRERFYIISDIAYADITFKDIKPPLFLKLKVQKM